MKKTKVLLVLLLLPMALGTTSLINTMRSGQSDFSSLSDHISSITDILSVDFENSLDLDKDGSNDTSLSISVVEEDLENDVWTQAPSERNLVLKVVATTSDNTTINDGICDCDSVQTIEFTIPSALSEQARRDCSKKDDGTDATDEENQVCQDEFKNSLLSFIRRKRSEITSKLNNQRLAQHERNLEEKDCTKKEDAEEKIECFINSLDGLEREQREEVFSEIEQEMEDLNYADEDEREVFDEMMKKLKDIRYASNLRSTLRRHQRVREDTLKNNQELEELTASINEARTGLTMAEQTYNSSNRNSWDFYRYQQESTRYNNELIFKTRELDQRKLSFEREMQNLIRRYQQRDNIFDQSDATRAMEYANRGFGFFQDQNRASVRRGSRRSVGGILNRFSSGSYYGGGLGSMHTQGGAYYNQNQGLRGQQNMMYNQNQRFQGQGQNMYNPNQFSPNQMRDPNFRSMQDPRRNPDGTYKSRGQRNQRGQRSQRRDR